MTFAQRVLTRHRQTGGSTTSPRTGLTPREGFAVSLYPDRTRSTNVALTESDIYVFRDHNADLLRLNGFFLGTWFDHKTSENVLDVVQVFSSVHFAKAVAREAGQCAIYCLATGTTIYLN